jgi:3'-phosphoadenosine 5'-phosphosulfate sulfotransferase (PAPS reductase)/FAD synthetase
MGRARQARVAGPRLTAAVARCRPPLRFRSVARAGPRGAIVVALSGGLDSTVLLHALAAMPKRVRTACARCTCTMA